MVKYFPSNGLLSDKQNIFRFPRSTDDVLTVIAERMVKLGLLRCLSKPFDRLWHTVLHMSKGCISGRIIELTQSYQIAKYKFS